MRYAQALEGWARQSQGQGFGPKEEENLQPSRDKIHDLFMEHVMAQAPGYKKLMDWTDAPIMPTPGAVGEIIKKIAEEEKISVVGVDIGGATTDIFSVFKSLFKYIQCVSVNLLSRMSKSFNLSNGDFP